MISGAVQVQMKAALDRAVADADAAEAAAPGTVSTWFAGVIGADSTASAAGELARRTRQDADRFQTRYAQLVADTSVSDADGTRFIADVNASVGTGAANVVAEATGLLSPVTAVTETAKGTAADIGTGVTATARTVASVGGWVGEHATLLLWVVAGFVLLMLASPLLSAAGSWRAARRRS